jgi:hypothetical protein
MLFPQGVDIDISDPLDKAKIVETREGRKSFEISFTSEESNLAVEVSLEIKPSGLFLLGLFIPCIISIFITIILIIVIIIIRRKRKARRPPVHEEPIEETISGYEDEEYYVPPPPGSK